MAESLCGVCVWKESVWSEDLGDLGSGLRVRGFEGAGEGVWVGGVRGFGMEWFCGA
jgi:hypothetical protein